MSMDLKSAPMSQEPTIIMDRGLEMESKDERKLLTNGGREKGERNRTIARIEAIDNGSRTIFHIFSFSPPSFL